MARYRPYSETYPELFHSHCLYSFPIGRRNWQISRCLAEDDQRYCLFRQIDASIHFDQKLYLFAIPRSSHHRNLGNLLIIKIRSKTSVSLLGLTDMGKMKLTF